MRSWIPALLWNWAAPWQAGGSLRGEGLVVAGGVINAARRLWRIRGNRNDLHALEDRLFA
jgi:hypothetical protein